MGMSETANRSERSGNTDNLPDPGTSFVIAKVDVHVFEAPVEPPIQSSFGLVHSRSSLLVCVEDTEGHRGWGEVWTGMPAFGAKHRAEILRRIVMPMMLGARVANIGVFGSMLRSALRPIERLAGEPGPVSHVVAGVDCALWDLAAKRSGMPLYRLLGGTVSTMATYASGIKPGVTDAELDVVRQQGFQAFKFKAGFDDRVTLSQLGDLHTRLHSHERMMIDANCGWDFASAKNAMDALAECPLEWIEEPVGPEVSASEWKSLAAHTRHPLAAGENLLSQDQFEAALDWLAVIQPDLGKWGGISGVVPLARRAVAQGKKFCPHTFGTYVGAAHAAHVLAAVGGSGCLELDANPNPLRTCSAQNFPAVSEGRLTLGSQPGIGIEVSIAALRPFSVPGV